MEVRLLKQALTASQTHASCNYILITAILGKLTLERLLVFLHSTVLPATQGKGPKNVLDFSFPLKFHMQSIINKYSSHH